MENVYVDLAREQFNDDMILTEDEDARSRTHDVEGIISARGHAQLKYRNVLMSDK